MGLKSMTGFGEGVATTDKIQVTVELSSVNRKQLDVNITLPRNLVTLDALVQGLVRKEFSRGRISGVVRVDVADGSSGTVTVDAQLAAQYVEGLRAVAETLELPDDLGAETLVKLPGLLGIDRENFEAGQVTEVLEVAMAKALRGLGRMRSAEGKVLEKDLRARLTLLEGMMKNIKALSTNVVTSYREKLLQRMADAGLDDLASDDRMLKEIAIFADRCDISEELTRLKSHLSQARKLLRLTEPVGRTLDFLCQELFREINTIGSKANEVEITRHVVAFKTELERIREQVQNVE